VGIQSTQYAPPVPLLQKVHIFDISYFSEPGKIQEIFKKTSLEGASTTVVDTQTSQDTLAFAFFQTHGIASILDF
jgi:hypothetical protein